MTDKELLDIADRIESAFALDADLSQRAIAALRRRLPSEIGAGLSGVTESTDGIIQLLRHTLPGWHLHMAGTAREPNGHWSASIRRSTVRDNDEAIGVGRGPTLPHALFAAFLRALAYGAAAG